MKAFEAHAWIDLDVRPHVHRAGGNGAYQGSPRTLEDVFLGEVALDARGFRNRFFEAAFDNAAAFDDARFVEMNMGFHQSGYDEPASGGFDQAGVGNGELRRNRHDFAVRDADVDHLLRVAG
jgi:hypothetical protein